MPPLGRIALAAYAGLTLIAVGRFLTTDVSEPFVLWSHIAYGWWIALTYTVTIMATGSAACRLANLNFEKSDALSRLLFYFTGGMFYSHTVLLILAVLNRLSLLPVLAVFIVPLIVAAPDLKHAVLRLWHWRPGPGNLHSGLRVLIVSFALVLISPYILQTLVPNSDWDAALHHLPIAQRFLDGQISELDPVFAPWSYPGAVHLVYASFLSVDAETAVIPFNFIAAAATLPAGYVLAECLSGRRAGVWAVMVLLSVNLILEQGLDARIDGFLALFFMIACYGLLLWLHDRSRHEALILAGAAAGLMVGTQYTGLLLAGVLFVPVLVTVLHDHARGDHSSVRALFFAGLLVIAPSSWWYARNFVELGDPIHEFLSGPMYVGIDGTIQSYADVREKLHKRLPPENVLSKAAFFHLFNTEEDVRVVEPANQLNLIDVVIHPDRYARSKRGQTLSVLLLFFLLLPLAGRSARILWCYAIGLGGFLIIGSMSNLTRYALPVWPLFAVVRES